MTWHQVTGTDSLYDCAILSHTHQEAVLIGNNIVIYISAAADLQRERDVLGRIATEIPVDKGWRIIQSPTGDGLLDIASIQNADIHFLLLGGDIRAPIGQEWIIARKSGRQPLTYLKQGILHTEAALDFARYIQAQSIWKHFKDTTDLRIAALTEITNRLLNFVLEYDLSLKDIENLHKFRDEIKKMPSTDGTHPLSGTDASSLILSAEDISTKGGVLLKK